MRLRVIAFLCVCGLMSAAAASPVLGTWKVNAKAPDGEQHKLSLEIRDEDGKLMGSLMTEEGASIPVRDMSLKGSELSFKIDAQGNAWAVKVTVTANSMKGNYTGESGESGPFEATR